MKFGPDNSFTRFVNSYCFYCAFTSIFKELGIVKAESIAFSNPVLSEFKRNHLDCLHICFIIRNIAFLSFFLKL